MSSLVVCRGCPAVRGAPAGGCRREWSTGAALTRLQAPCTGAGSLCEGCASARAGSRGGRRSGRTRSGKVRLANSSHRASHRQCATRAREAVASSRMVRCGATCTSALHNMRATRRHSGTLRCAAARVVRVRGARRGHAVTLRFRSRSSRSPMACRSCAAFRPFPLAGSAVRTGVRVNSARAIRSTRTHAKRCVAHPGLAVRSLPAAPPA